MPLTILNGPVIAAGASLSDGIDCRAGPLRRITMPVAWNGTKISFQISSDGNGYNDLFYPDGTEVRMVVTTGAAVRVSEEWTPMIAFLKIRSGTRSNPVRQLAQREFALAVETPPP